MKRITILWTFFLIGLLTALTIWGFKYKEIINYKKLEKQMINNSKQYLKNRNISIFKNKTVSIKLKELINFEPNLNDYRIDNCDGKVTIKKIAGFKFYKAIIKCDNYES